MRKFWMMVAVFVLACGVRADGPGDNVVGNVRAIPPVPKMMTAGDRADVEAGVKALGEEIGKLREELKGKTELLALLPDVEIYYDALRYPIAYNEPYDMKLLRKQIAEGMERAKELAEGKAPWVMEGGARGYVSKIDGSVQPYVVGAPKSYAAGSNRKYRLDFFCHGRGEDLMESKFIAGGKPAANEKFVVNLYGRYCNANKFAGEIDLLEVLEAMKRQYPIDENRIVETGFSMGGAAAWQFAVHYTDLFCAASPGAGFAETKEFLRVFQNEPVKPAWYEQKLWHVYDCTDYAANIFNLPLVAYSGEIDRQKQAADVMEKAMAEEGLKLDHRIGPKTAHAYEKETKARLDKSLDEYAARGRNTAPKGIRFTTWTLRYNHMFWVNVQELERHWERARVDAKLVNREGIEAKTVNVAAVKFEFAAGEAPFEKGSRPVVVVDGTRIEGPVVGADGAWQIALARRNRDWKMVAGLEDGKLRKRPGLQGPIDDAFLDRFIIVKPTGTSANEQVGKWASGECEHAILHWHKQFRGEAMVKNDVDVSEADIASSNLVLFGDPASNKIIARIAEKLPIRWSGKEIAVGEKTFPAEGHAVAMIYPNPLNAKKYIVLNSGFTFREYDYLNNARQVSKLPDYAVIDVTVPVSARTPGGIAAGGFFGEGWELQKDDGKN
ncbi:MAG TPA: prolyl oligopeptidase family serine peptidase [Tepidisphaeraceae bacterium]|jgi:dienelactone hydrolase|nr:prolyl oligopeptidase family serine peptidase [Tepidisphaeraceae bacterium]